MKKFRVTIKEIDLNSGKFNLYKSTVISAPSVVAAVQKIINSIFFFPEDSIENPEPIQIAPNVHVFSVRADRTLYKVYLRRV